MGGNFITNSGITDRSLFDNWSKTATGEPKVSPSVDSPLKYDHVMIILRNGIGLNKNGNTSFGGLGIPLLGYQSDTYTFQGTFDLIPTEICRHEFAHQLLGSNNFHCTGNAPDANYWIPIPEDIVC